MSANLRKSDPSEIQTRNGQDHVRGYNPLEEDLLQEILRQLRETNFHLRIITEEKYDH